MQMVYILFTLWGFLGFLRPVLLVPTVVLTLASGVSYIRVGTRLISAGAETTP